MCMCVQCRDVQCARGVCVVTQCVHLCVCFGEQRAAGVCCCVVRVAKC